MGFVIKKRVSLDFLGEEYKESELVFRSIPAKDLSEIIKETEAASEKPAESIPTMVNILQRYFLEGKHEGAPLSKEDIDELDAESIIKCFKRITGQDIDPKVDGQSTSTSGTEASEAQK